jgi:hypothetical protein
VTVQGMKLAQCLAPGRSVRPRAIAVVDELREHRAAGFRLLERLSRQRVGQEQGVLVRHLGHDRAFPFCDPQRSYSASATIMPRGAARVTERKVPPGGKWIGGLARLPGMGHEQDEFAEFYQASKDSCLKAVTAVASLTPKPGSRRRR